MNHIRTILAEKSVKDYYRDRMIPTPRTRRFQASTALFAVALASLMLVTPFAIRADVRQQAAADGLNVFVIQQPLAAPDAAAGDDFGDAVAISGNTAVIGAPGSPLDGTTTARGAAYVFVRSGTVWTFQAKLVPGDFSPGMRFGEAVSVSGNVAVVGAPSHDVSGRADAGAAYVFRRSGTTWQQDARLTGDSAALEFGRTLAIDGNTVVVGADDADSRGSAFVFVTALSSTLGGSVQWVLQQKLLAPNGQPGDDFAESVALRSTTIVAGARDAVVGGEDRGAAYVFNRVGSSWVPESQALLAPDGQADDSFGRTVAFDGVRAMIAAPDADVAGISAGAVYAFLRQGTAWVFEQKLTPDQPRGDTDFGRALAFDGAIAVAGIPESTTREGFVFRLSGGVWLRERLDPINTARLASVALQGTTLIVGNDRSPGTATVFVDEELTNGFALTAPVVTAVVNGSTVTVSWSTVGGATRYQARAGTFPGGSNAFDGNVGNTTTLVANNVPNGRYFVRVHAATGVTESAASNEVRVDVGPTGGCQLPATPLNLTFARTGSIVTLTWTASTNATSYLVEAGSSSGLANIVTIDTGSTSSQLTANAPPGTYFVRVRGKNQCGVSAVSNQVVIAVS